MHIKTTEITKKLKQWYKEASDMMVYNPNVALKLTDRIINNATTPEVSKYLVWGASLKGCCLRKLGHSDEALNILEEAQRLHQYHTPQDKNLLVSILNNKGNAYLKKGNHQLALNAFLKCLPIAKSKTLIGLHNNIGITYASMGNMSEAVKYWKKAEANTELDNDLFAKANIKSNILNYYVLTEKIERAKQKAEETIALMESHPEQRQRLTSIYINVFNNLGHIYRKHKDFEKAENVLNEALVMAQKAALAEQCCKTLHSLATIYFEKQDEEKALSSIQKALDYANKFGLRDEKRAMLENVIQFYKKNNQTDKAFPFLEMLYELSQEHLAESKGKNLQKIIAEREQEIQLLEEKNKEIQEQNAILKQFTYVISHDLREPIRGISGFANMLNSKYSQNLDKTGNEYIKFILSEAHVMNSNLARLLEYTTIEKNADNIKEIDLQQTITKIQRQYQEEEEFQLNISYEGVPIKMQHQHAVLLLSELIDNAVQFKKEGEDCQIEIKCELKEGHYHLSVKDYGIGIDTVYHNKVFKIFNKINKWEGTGTGVGLAICERIAHLYKGEISVESIPDKFTTFHIKIAA